MTMIDPKYANLPGIAYDQPDVYETEDCPENHFQDYVQEDGDSVEKIYISAQDAFGKFKDKQINQRGINFSDAISTIPKNYEFSNSISLKDSQSKQDESLSEKLERIKQEIKEFMDQINIIKITETSKNNESAKSLIDIIYQVESAGKELDAVNIDTILNNSTNTLCHSQEIRFRELISQIEIFKRKTSTNNSCSMRDSNMISQESSTQGSLKYQMIYFPDKAKIEDMARLSDLEKRIGHIENVIGYSTNNTSKYSQILKSQGISQSIEKLMASACLLNSTQLDILENKVSSLLHKMDNIVQKKTISGLETNNEKIIIELYEIVKNSETHSQILPQIIDRMILLSHLHQRAGNFSNQLKELENFKQNIDGALSNNKTILEEIQKNFSKNLETIVNDVTVLTQRIKKLKSNDTN